MCVGPGDWIAGSKSPCARESSADRRNLAACGDRGIWFPSDRLLVDGLGARDCIRGRATGKANWVELLSGVNLKVAVAKLLHHFVSSPEARPWL